MWLSPLNLDSMDFGVSPFKKRWLFAWIFHIICSLAGFVCLSIFVGLTDDRPNIFSSVMWCLFFVACQILFLQGKMDTFEGFQELVAPSYEVLEWAIRKFLVKYFFVDEFDSPLVQKRIILFSEEVKFICCCMVAGSLGFAAFTFSPLASGYWIADVFVGGTLGGLFGIYLISSSLCRLDFSIHEDNELKLFLKSLIYNFVSSAILSVFGILLPNLIVWSFVTNYPWIITVQEVNIQLYLKHHYSTGFILVFFWSLGNGISNTFLAYKLKFVPPRGYKESSLVGPIATLVSGLSGTLLWSTSDSKGVLGSFVKKLAFKDLYLATGAKNDPRKAILRKPKTEDMKTLNILIGHCIDALNEYCGKVRTYVVPPNRYERGDFQQIFTDLEITEFAIGSLGNLYSFSFKPRVISALLSVFLATEALKKKLNSEVEGIPKTLCFLISSLAIFGIKSRKQMAIAHLEIADRLEKYVSSELRKIVAIHRDEFFLHSGHKDDRLNDEFWFPLGEKKSFGTQPDHVSAFCKFLFG